MKVSREPDSVVVTYALGSCIGLVLHDPLARVGGLLHLMLPESGVDAASAAHSPYRYADSGVPLLLRAVLEAGAQRSRLRAVVAGGASVVDDGGVFNIGKRNTAAVKKLLWKAGVPVFAEDTGGVNSRTLGLEVATGRIWMRGPAGEVRDLAGPAAAVRGEGAGR
jgi:chemotaxis protein CheD